MIEQIQVFLNLLALLVTILSILILTDREADDAIRGFALLVMLVSFSWLAAAGYLKAHANKEDKKPETRLEVDQDPG